MMAAWQPVRDGSGTDRREHGRVRRVRAVREVQAEDVHARHGAAVRGHQAQSQAGPTVAMIFVCRIMCIDSLATDQAAHGSTSALVMRIASASASASFSWCSE